MLHIRPLTLPGVRPTRLRPLALSIACALSGTGVATAQPAASIEEVLVTATLLPRTVDEIAGTVSVINAAELSQQMAEDLDDIIRFQPGLSMDTASRGGNQGFVIRGIGGNRVLTVIDGIRSNDIYAAGPSSYGKDAFEVDDLRAVEVIRGPASVLYGADAMGGAVILRTRDPADYLPAGKTSAFSLRSSTSSANDQIKTGLSHAFQNDSVGTLLQLTRRDFQETDIGGSARLNAQDGSNESVLLKSVWTPSDTQRLRLTVDSSVETIDTRMDSDLSASVRQSTGIDTSDRLRVSLTHAWTLEQPFADTLETQWHWQRTDGEQRSRQLLTSYAFVNRADRSSYGGTLAERFTDFDFDQRTRSAGLLFTKAFSQGTLQHAMVYGMHLDETQTQRPRQRCDTQVSTGTLRCAIPSYPFAPPEVFPNKTFPDTTTTRAGLYWQDEIRLGDSGLTLIPGLRHDRYQMDPHPDALLNGGGDISRFGGFDVVAVDEEHLSLTLGLLYALNDASTVFAQYAEGYRPPNFDESNQAFVNLGHGYATVPNPALEPETSQGLEAGLRTRLGEAALSVAVYDNRYDQFIESQVIGNANGVSLFQDTNLGEARVYGAEISGDWAFAPQWALNGSLAWSRGTDVVNDRPLNAVEPLTTVVSLRHDARSGRWGLQTLLTHVGEQNRVSAPDRVKGEAYTVLDVVAHYHWGERATVRVGFFNLLDRQYARWNSVKGLAASDTTSIARAQAAGANFRLGFHYDF